MTFVDPVCGMKVGASAPRAEGFEGVAFCSPGCRKAFLADPAAYGFEAAVIKPEDEMGDSDNDE